MTIFSSTGHATRLFAFKFWPLTIRSPLRRDLLLIAIWSIVAIAISGFILTSMYRKNAERHFHDLLRAELYNVVDTMKVSDQGALNGSPLLGDIRFSQPHSGWYWIAEPGDNVVGKRIASFSLGTSGLPIASELEAPFDQNYERFYKVTDAFGNRVEVVETQVVLEPDGRYARFRVAGNTAVVEDDVRDFSYGFYLTLAGFGIGSMIVVAFIRCFQ